MIDKNSLMSELAALGIRLGDILHLKVSMKAVGNIDGGANTLIDALLETVGPTGTIVCDSFVESQLEVLRLFKKKVFSKNAVSYAGAFVNAMIKYPGVYRSSHPIQAFCAIGLKAKELTESFTVDSLPYEFLEKLVSMNAKNLKIGPEDKVVGVGTTHIAICRLGFWQKQLPKGIYYYDDKHKLKWFRQSWADGCRKGFANLSPLYYEKGGVIAKGKLGETTAVVTDMKKTLEIEYDLLKHDPSAFMCNKKDCVYCSFTWENSKYSFRDCFFENIHKKQYKKALQAFGIAVIGKKLN